MGPAHLGVPQFFSPRAAPNPPTAPRFLAGASASAFALPHPLASTSWRRLPAPGARPAASLSLASLPRRALPVRPRTAVALPAFSSLRRIGRGAAGWPALLIG
ncbi:hypothetical protein U9M48_033104 [Paspalum notatum var. saurae]|uniref:Uncharacterized protein n=1 Tax=Paspalum notatum var. saurae TaxID=547442 RepID=A0AAQ3U7C2_PASNO